MITFEHVTVKTRDTTLLHDVSFTVNDSEKVIIGGISGSGKSTVLLTLMGAYTPSEGRIQVGDLKLTSITAGDIRKATAFIGQEPVLGTGKVRDGLLLPFGFKANRNTRPTNERIAEMLERLRLSENILDRDIARISGGEKQRIAIARALLAGKSIFIADEITSALDEESNRIVLDLFLRPEFTVLAVSHHPQWLTQFDKQIHIHEGSVAWIRHKKGETLQ